MSQRPELGTAVASDALVARSASAAVVLATIRRYSWGAEADVQFVVRDAVPAPPWQSLLAGQGPETLRAGFGTPQSPPEPGIALSSRFDDDFSGSVAQAWGDDGQYTVRFRLEFERAESLAFAVSWPERGIELTRTEIPLGGWSPRLIWE